MASEDPVARGIALFSLAVSAGGLVWNIHVGRRDNPGVRLGLRLAYIFREVPGQGQERHGPYVGYEVMVSVQARLQTRPRRACPTRRDALQPRHARDDAAAGGRARGDDSDP